MTVADSDDTHPGACINCGSPLTGAHCHGCGQPAHVHRSIAAIGHDLLHGVLHLDGKLAATLPLLAVKPGQLTRRYIHGERRRFVSPMGMFLFSVTILFLAMQVLGVHIGEVGEQASIGPALARAEQALAKTIAEPLPDSAYTRGTAVGTEVGERDPTPEVTAATRKSQDEVRARATRTIGSVRQARALWRQDGDIESIQGGPNNPAVFETMLKKFKTDPGLVLYKMKANSYKFSWALIPLSVPFVWLLFFWRRDLGLYDHAVFVTYSIAFVTLLTTLLMILTRLGVSPALTTLAFTLIPPVHIFVQLRGAYALQKRWAFLRTLLLLGFITLIIGLFAAILLALGALG